MQSSLWQWRLPRGGVLHVSFHGGMCPGGSGLGQGGYKLAAPPRGAAMQAQRAAGCVVPRIEMAGGGLRCMLTRKQQLIAPPAHPECRLHMHGDKMAPRPTLAWAQRV